MKINELLEQLPASWEQTTLEQFQKLTSIELTEDSGAFNGVQNSLEVISKLSGVSVEDLEELPMKDIQTLGSKISFMVTPPVPAKTCQFTWKKVDEITYNDYVNFIQLQDKQIENLHVFIRNFSTTKLTEYEILQLPITEVITGFFLFRKQLQSYLQTSILLTKTRLVKFKLKDKFQRLKWKTKR